jgi:competence protein ComEC
MSGRVFYAVAVGFAGGIFVRSVLGVGNAVAYAELTVGCALALLWYVRKGAGDGRAPVLALVCICAALGVLRFDISTWGEQDELFEQYLGEKVMVEGVIVREVDERAKNVQLMVQVESVGEARASRRVLVIADRFSKFEYGDRVRAEGTLEKPETFETDLGRTFDYPGYLSARGISYTMPRANVERIGGGEGNPVLTFLFSVKRAFVRNIESLLPEPQAGLAEGLVLGVKRALGKDLENAFRDTGVIHIIVLSGYNVTIVVEAVMRLLFFLRPKARAAAGGAGILAFALIAGLSASVLRASLMAGLVLLARATGRKYDILRALVFAGVVMLVFNPKLLVFDPGFQLSFLATLGLVLVAPLVEQKLWRVPTRLQIREFVTSTIATQILVLPLLLYSTGILSVVALIVNVLVLPVVPLTMLLVFLSGAIGFLSHILALPVAYGAYILLGYIITVVEWFASLPFAAFSIPAFPFWIVALSYLVIALVLWRVYRKQKPPNPSDSAVSGVNA